MWELLSVCAFGGHGKKRRARRGRELEDWIHAINGIREYVGRALGRWSVVWQQWKSNWLMSHKQLDAAKSPGATAGPSGNLVWIFAFSSH